MGKLNIYNMGGSPGMNADRDLTQLAARLSRIEDVVPYSVRGGTYATQGRNKFLPLVSTGLNNGKLSISSTSAINFQGAMAPSVVDGQMTVACPSSTTATIYWDGTNSSRVILIRRSDQTVQTVPGNTISLTGLTASASYSAYSYWTPANACGLGWAQGDTGTPQIAFSSSATATQLLQAKASQHFAGREEISSISWTQPAGGGSSGPTNPTDPNEPSPGLCVRLGTHIEPLGDWGKSEVRELIHPNEKWVRLETNRGLVLECTPDHPIYHEERGKLTACEFKAGDNVITRFGVQTLKAVTEYIHACNKVEVQMKFGHLFWANGFLSHNFKPK